MPEPVDFLGTRVHFLDHMRPVAEALGDRVGVTYEDPGHLLERHADRITVVSAYADLKSCYEAGRRRLVLMEHGAGQSYSDRNRSYVGGYGREMAAVVLVPNEMAKARHDHYYPKRPARVVGSPWADHLLETYQPSLGHVPPTVAVSWHWPCAIWEESGSAWEDYGDDVLDMLLTMQAAGFIEVLGHAHPRVAEALGPIYRDKGIRFIERWESVYPIADVYLCDNSSTIFEFAHSDRPVVLMNSPRWKRRRDHGLRFWSEAGVGIQIDRPGDLAGALAVAITDPAEVADQRRQIMARVFPHKGEAAQRAVAEILSLDG